MYRNNRLWNDEYDICDKFRHYAVNLQVSVKKEEKKKTLFHYENLLQIFTIALYFIVRK